MEMKLYTDGGARGNPGPGAVGVVLKDSKNTKVKEIGKYIGECTNNEAEYTALIEGLKAAKKAKATNLECFLDSELIVKQLRGSYKVKNERMKKLWLQVKDLEKGFKTVSYNHIVRSKNRDADELVNEVLDAQKGKK